MTDLQLALAHYRIQFPTLADLGGGSPPAIWYEEYKRVSECALHATLVTSVNYEGGAGSGTVNFPQRVVLAALHARRAELDPTYEEAAYAPAPLQPRKHLGILAIV